MTAVSLDRQNPRWWTDSHSSAWERVKVALKRDWEQTKVDLGASGAELKQNLTHTVRQALGKEPIPKDGLPNPSSHDRPQRWEDVEDAMRYGYGARQHYSDTPEWDEELETRLREDWEHMAPARTWHDVRQFVHRGWLGP